MSTEGGVRVCVCVCEDEMNRGGMPIADDTVDHL